jgi:hypothetical protein
MHGVERVGLANGFHVRVKNRNAGRTGPRKKVDSNGISTENGSDSYKWQGDIKCPKSTQSVWKVAIRKPALILSNLSVFFNKLHKFLTTGTNQLFHLLAILEDLESRHGIDATNLSHSLCTAGQTCPYRHWLHTSFCPKRWTIAASAYRDSVYVHLQKHDVRELGREFVEDRPNHSAWAAPE